MKKCIILVIVSAAALAGGCSGLPPLHPLKLIFPSQNCGQTPFPCAGFRGCYDLGINELHINVGPTHSEDTTFLCVSNGSSINSQVYYQPGQDYYMIIASYVHERNGSIVELTSGPFSEDEAQTPWTLPIH